MKPSLLRISGLNSFSQTETIDFAKLTEKGLFGIFGPTGSGKSTVLDAITLALYGDVARKTKSYINSDCEKVNIYFEFFSGHGKDRKKYIIDRTIKRTKTGTQTANITLEVYSRDGEIKESVIEKRSAVEKELIENIVKLNFEDFIRTVVLPQGKFSEFLTLTGAERNNMLERILGLEEYGQSLTEKINAKKTLTNNELSKLEGERSRYSESSLEKIQELEKAKVALIMEEQTLKGEIDKLEYDYKKYSNVFELQQELDGHMLVQRKLLDDRVKMKVMENKFSMARDALHITPFIDAFDKSVADKSENTVFIQTLQTDLAELKDKLKIVEDAYQKAYDIKEKDYEKLLEKKSKLNTVIELERDNIESKEFLERENKELSCLKKNIDYRSQKLKEIEANIVALEKEIIELEDSIKKKGISSSYRKILIEGLEVEKSFKQIEKELKDKSEDILEIAKRVKNGNKKLRELKDSRNSVEDELERQRECYMTLSECLVSKELYSEQLRKEIESEKEKSIASRVAMQLEQGRPCPVCGSIEHPNVVREIDQTQLDKKEKKRQILESDIRLLSGVTH